MPNLDLDRQIFAAGGNAANEWGQVAGKAEVQFRGQGALKRGLDVELGLGALANLDASFRKYLAGELQGQLQAHAGVRAQVQLPLNLFDEIGFAVRLEAIAELAAGVRAGLGLSIGDFLALVERDSRMRGLPAELLKVFLEEITLQASLFVKAALTAQAYANVVVTGSAVENLAAGIRPGFNVVCGLGAGLKGGAGYRVFVQARFDSFSRYIARTVDLVVDAAADAALDQVPANDTNTRLLIDVARPASKCALRLSFELGEYLAKNDVPRSAAGAQAIALRCSQVVLEECQRFLLSSMVQLALDDLRAWLATRLLGVSPAAWAASGPRRRALADRLQALPQSPFTPTPQNVDYWNGVLTETLSLALDLENDTLSTDRRQSLAVLWAATQLGLLAAERVARAAGSVNIIGLAPQTAHASFEGPLATQPHPQLRQHMRQRLVAAGAADPGSTLKREHLIEFLVQDTVLDPLRAQVPAVDEFLSLFDGRIADARNDIARLLLVSLGSIRTDGAGRLDDRATLTALNAGLKQFAHQKLEAELLPALTAYLAPRADVRTYFDEVFAPSLLFATDTAFDAALQWQTTGISRDQLTEALSAVLLRVIGRSLVVTTDLVMAKAQEQLATILTDLAGQVDAPNGLVATLAAQPNVGLSNEDLADLLRESLLVGAEVFGPLPDATRARVRQLLYEVIEPLPLDAQADFLEQLGDSFFIPNLPRLQSLAQELSGIAIERFAAFAQRILLRIAELIVEELQELLEAARQQVVEWMDELSAGLAALQVRLLELAAAIAELVAEVQALFDQALDALQDALGAISGPGGRARLKDRLTDLALAPADALLFENVVYTTLAPASARAGIRQSMRGALRAALDSALLDPVLDLVTATAAGADELLEDVRALDPTRPLHPQLANLLLNRVTEGVAALFGGANPSLPLSFTASWTYPVLRWVGVSLANPSGFAVVNETASYHISLGRIEIPLHQLLAALREAVETWSSFETLVQQAAGRLATAFAGELQLGALEDERTTLESEALVMAADADDMAPGPRSVDVVSPRPLQLVEDDLELHLVLRGVPRSFLGEDPVRRPRRVHVFMNGEPLPLERFTVQEIPAATTARTPPALGTRITAETLGRSALTAHWSTLDPGGQLRDGGNDRASGRARLSRRGGSADRSSSAAPDAPAGRGTYAPRGSARPPIGPGTNHRPDNGRGLLPIGRGALPTDIARVFDGRLGTEDALVLRAAVRLDELLEGANTLVVAIIDGATRREEARLTFLAAAAPDDADDRSVRLPDRHGRVRRPDARPQRVLGGRLLLRPRSERRELVRHERVRAVVIGAPPDPLARVREASSVLAERIPVRVRIPQEASAQVNETEQRTVTL